MDQLLIDVSPYSAAIIKPEAWTRVAQAGEPWAGVVLKAGEGARDCGRWVREHAVAVREAKIPLGLYWYLRLGEPAEVQAEVFARLMAEVAPSIWPVVDVEEGSGNAAFVEQRGPELVRTATEAFVARVRERTGLPSILYTGGWVRGLGLRSLMGCEALWLAAYTEKLSARWYEQDLGCPRERLWAWQYAGFDGRRMLGCLDGYPRTSPVGEQCDISAIVMPDGMQRVGVAERPSCA